MLLVLGEYLAYATQHILKREDSSQKQRLSSCGPSTASGKMSATCLKAHPVPAGYATKGQQPRAIGVSKGKWHNALQFETSSSNCIRTCEVSGLAQGPCRQSKIIHLQLENDEDNEDNGPFPMSNCKSPWTCVRLRSCSSSARSYEARLVVPCQQAEVFLE